MSALDFLGLVVFCVVIAFVYLHVWADIVARPRRLSRQEAEAMRGLWWYDGWRWHYRGREDV